MEGPLPTVSRLAEAEDEFSDESRCGGYEYRSPKKNVLETKGRGQLMGGGGVCVWVPAPSPRVCVFSPSLFLAFPLPCCSGCLRVKPGAVPPQLQPGPARLL